MVVNWERCVWGVGVGEGGGVKVLVLMDDLIP